MKICFRDKCKKEFEPNKPKQVFCSAKCRVYFSRELAVIKLRQINRSEKSIDVTKLINVQESQNKPHTDTKKENVTETMPQFKNDIERMFWEEKQKLKNK